MIRLEAPTPLPDSLLWRWQRGFYEAAGPGAWRGGGVPWRITSSVVQAHALAEVLAAFASTLTGRLEVLELGAGPGRLASHLCRELMGRQVSFRYVLSDVVATNVEAWRTHAQLRPFIDEGVLDVALHDAVSPALPHLLECDAPLTVQPGGGLVVIANYLFDTLPQELVRVADGQVQRGLVTLSAHAADAALDTLQWETSFVPWDAPPFVTGYARAAGEGTRFIPVGGLECLKAVAGATSAPTLVVVADKGSAGAPKDLRDTLPLSRHGCVSASVNFHALRAWAGWRLWLEPSPPTPDFGVYAVGERLAPSTRSALAQVWPAALGASPALVSLKRLDEALVQAESVDATQALRLLADSRFDPDALLRLSQPLRDGAAALPAELGPLLLEALEATWANAFDLFDLTDPAFDIATVLHRAGLLADAARFYETSLGQRGEHATTRFNLALCWLDLKDPRAVEALEATLQLAPDHPRAQALLDAVVQRGG